MPVLTEDEVQMLVEGGNRGTREEKRAAVKKLSRLQMLSVEPAHIVSINAFIPRAMVFADASDAPFDKAFHGEMNRLTKKAGLRR